MEPHVSEGPIMSICRDTGHPTCFRLVGGPEESWLKFDCCPGVKAWISTLQAKRDVPFLPFDLPEFPFFVFGPTKTIQQISNIGPGAIEHEYKALAQQCRSSDPIEKLAASNRLQDLGTIINRLLVFLVRPCAFPPPDIRSFFDHKLETGDPVADSEASKVIQAMERSPQMNIQSLERFICSAHPLHVAFKVLAAVIIRCHQVRPLPNRVQPGTAQFLEYLAEIATSPSPTIMEESLPMGRHPYTQVFNPHAAGVRSNHPGLHPAGIMIALNLYQFSRLKELGTTNGVRGWRHPVYEPRLTKLRNDLIRYFLTSGRKVLFDELVRVQWRVDKWFDHIDSPKRPMPGSDARTMDTYRLLRSGKSHQDPAKRLELLLAKVPAEPSPVPAEVEEEESSPSRTEDEASSSDEMPDLNETQRTAPSSQKEPRLTTVEDEPSCSHEAYGEDDEDAYEDELVLDITFGMSISDAHQDFLPPRVSNMITCMKAAKSLLKGKAVMKSMKQETLEARRDELQAQACKLVLVEGSPVYETLASVPRAGGSSYEQVPARLAELGMLELSLLPPGIARLSAEQKVEHFKSLCHRQELELADIVKKKKAGLEARPLPQPPQPSTSRQAQLMTPPPLPFRLLDATNAEILRAVGEQQKAERGEANNELLSIRMAELEPGRSRLEDEELERARQKAKTIEAELDAAQQQERKRQRKNLAKKERRQARKQLEKQALQVEPQPAETQRPEEGEPSSFQLASTSSHLQAEEENLSEAVTILALSEPEQQDVATPSELAQAQEVSLPESESKEDWEGAAGPPKRNLTGWDRRRLKKRERKEREAEEKRRREEEKARQREAAKAKAEAKLAKRLAEDKKRWDEEKRQREEEECLRIEREAEQLARAMEESLRQAKEDETLRKVKELAKTQSEVKPKTRRADVKSLETWRAKSVPAESAGPATSVLPVPSSPSSSSSSSSSSAGPVPALPPSPVRAPVPVVSPAHPAVAVSPCVLVAPSPRSPVLSPARKPLLRLGDVTLPEEDFAKTGESLLFSSHRPVISIPQRTTTPPVLVSSPTPLAMNVPSSPVVQAAEARTRIDGGSAHSQLRSSPPRVAHEIVDDAVHRSAERARLVHTLALSGRELDVARREEAVGQREYAVWDQEQELWREQKKMKQQREAFRQLQRALDLREVAIRGRENNLDALFHAWELRLEAREAEVVRREKAANERDTGVYHRIRQVGLREEEVYRREMAVYELEHGSSFSPDITPLPESNSSSLEINSSSLEISSSPIRGIFTSSADTTWCTQPTENQTSVEMEDPESRYNRRFHGSGRSRSNEPVERRNEAVHGSGNVREALSFRR
ncbi:hypothetical protein QC761_311440 [Podospora bellae-mahoneyi]|uniref:Uncharacterized protein n=1 Tax=Podospora bellae-mahoneyi TaxID=2093777 RepID=A0ABR0FM90_9PEZI|nr:hypothetical protein QC761_311440 [Podospora bellae-mahoneyi]